MQYNWTFRLGCFNMFTGILMGALGGHKKWERDVQDNFSRAQLMNFVSNVGILVASQKSIYPAIAFQLGIFLFSGSIYHRCFTGDKEATKSLPPIGGTLMMVGWLILLL
ncbi:hypothetical protein pb186bvf_019251 [Paramecium bursaria]